MKRSPVADIMLRCFSAIPRELRQMLRSIKRSEILGILLAQNVAWQAPEMQMGAGTTNK